MSSNTANQTIATVSTLQKSSITSTDLLIRAITGSIAIILNGSLLVVIIARKKLHSTTNTIMGSLFFSDIAYAALYVIVYWFDLGYDGIWVYCDIIKNINFICSSVINLHLMVASLDKLLAMKFPFRYRIYSRSRYAILAVTIIWILTIFAGILPLIIFRYDSQSTCKSVSNPRPIKEILFRMGHFVFFVIIPVTIMAICYYNVYKIATRNFNNLNGKFGSNLKSIRKHIRIACLLGLLVVLYCLTWLPLTISLALRIFLQISNVGGKALQKLHDVVKRLRYLALSYIIINPIVYSYFIKEISDPIRKIFCKRCNVCTASS
ncbi:Alpha-1B adrenergic receptor [Trichoplax sp. H2]|nr:Alpha-1B adrenergic receptor [Trichoplax sp. H2]|eukprot:RDD42878.1 Alpha-1B adrenergic receptor [Trichoplax sp. H2]